MKILVYNGDFNLPSFVHNLGYYLTRNGHSVIFMGHSAKAWAFKVNGIRYYPLPQFDQPVWLLARLAGSLGKLLLRKPKAILAIWKTLKEDHALHKGQKGILNWLMDALRLSACKRLAPNVIHNQWAPSLAAIGPLFQHYPVVQSLHGRLEDVTPFHNQTIAEVYKQYFPLLKGLQADSHLLLSNAELFGAKTKNAMVTHALVSTDWLQQPRLKNPEPNHLQIISIGKFTWQKGYLHALEAMSLLKGIPFHYQIIGWGADTEIRFHIDDLGLTEHVTIHHNLPHNVVRQKLGGADVLLLASVEEGFATVVTEAMAAGVPVISTDCGGMGELINNRVNGWLIPQRDPKAIAEALKEMKAMKPEALLHLTRNANNLVKHRLTWEQQITKYEKLYEQSIA